MLAAFPSVKTGITGAKIGSKYVYDMLTSKGYCVRIVDRSLFLNSPIDNMFYKYLYRLANFFNYFIILTKLIIHFIFFKPHSFYTVGASSKIGFLRDLIVLSLVKFFKVKTIVHVRNGNFSEIFDNSGFLVKIYCKLIDDIIFLDETLLVNIKKESFKNIHVIANPIDKEIVATPIEVQAKKTGRILKFIYVSNLIESKGYFDLLSSLLHLTDEERGSISVEFFGKFESQSKKLYFEKFIKSNNLDDVAYYRGVVYDRLKLKEVYLSSDVIVLPTYYPNEAQPRCLIEALSSACIIVATKHASIYGTFADASFIHYVDKKNPESIAKAVSAIIKDKSNIEDQFIVAREYYIEHFSDQVLNNKLLRLFR